MNCMFLYVSVWNIFLRNISVVSWKILTGIIFSKKITYNVMSPFLRKNIIILKYFKGSLFIASVIFVANEGCRIYLQPKWKDSSSSQKITKTVPYQSRRNKNVFILGCCSFLSQKFHYNYFFPMSKMKKKYIP